MAVKKSTSKKKSAPKKRAVPKKKAVVKKKSAPKKKAAIKKKAAPKKKAAVKKETAPEKTLPKRKIVATKPKPPTKPKVSLIPDEPIVGMTLPVEGIDPYAPSKGEMYMSDGQHAHFRHILIEWKKQLMEEVDRTVHHMKDEAANFPDPNDRATQESEFGLELRTRDRERKLLRKIDSALARIDDGSYGFCEETGEEIGLKRLEARPVATLCLEAQERRELAERQFRDRDDRYR